MTETLAILYAPNSRLYTRNSLIFKLNNIIEPLNVGRAQIIVNPDFPITIFLNSRQKSQITVVFGWGLKGEPSWETIIPEPKYLVSVRQLIAIDLLEREGFDGRVLEKPMINAGKYWSKKMQQDKQKLFFAGYFLHPSTPYGLKKANAFKIDDSSKSENPLFVSKPGESAEVEIVKIIFDLFVGHDYNLSEICNLLNAQEINAPKSCKAWNPRSIKTILKCPLYIGANQFRGFIKYDVFPSIIEKTVYFEAQAKLSQMRIIAGSDSLDKRTRNAYSNG